LNLAYTPISIVWVSHVIAWIKIKKHFLKIVNLY
jgi:hypothetical protein